MVGVWNTEQEGSCLQGCFSGGAHEQSFQAGVEPSPACENTRENTHTAEVDSSLSPDQAAGMHVQDGH